MTIIQIVMVHKDIHINDIFYIFFMYNKTNQLILKIIMCVF